MRQADGVIDQVHGEPCRLEPQTKSQYSGRGEDTGRAQVEFTAVLEWPAESARIGLHADVTTRRPRLIVMEARLPRAQVKIGDRVVCVERGESFEVRAIHPEGMTRYELMLSQEAGD